MSTRYDVLGLGNAIVDVMSRRDDAFLATHGMTKGAMTLIDEARAEELLTATGNTVAISGGSVANSMHGVAALGGRAAFVGKVKADILGEAFARDMRAAGVAFGATPAANGPSTGRCFIIVTPDGQRTMNTYLGAAQFLSPRDIDADAVGSAAVTYLEGYLWDPKDAKDAFVAAAAHAHKAGRQVALSLSDAFCVGRWREEFLGLMRARTVDLVFANETELLALYPGTDFATALAQIGKDVACAVVTRGADGAVVTDATGTFSVPAAPVSQVVDTTGAGDLFAAGFLYALTRGGTPVAAAQLGAMAAGEVISHLGARPLVDLKLLAAAEGLPV